MKRPQSNRHIFTNFVFAVFLLVYLLIGFRIYPDYGVPIDEYSQIDLGRVNYERVVAKSPEIQTHYDRYYGPAFEVPLYMFSHRIGPLLGIDEMSARHLGIFLFFTFSLVFFYVLLTKMNGYPAYGLLGVLLLVLSPRFFAESFYNTKDIAFLSATIFVLWALSLLKKLMWPWVLLLAATTGFAMAVRAQGLLLLLVMTLVLVLIGKKKMSQRIAPAVSYTVGALMTAFALFPVFWNDTMRNIVGYWMASSHPVGVPTYYFGASYISPGLPWHYHFVWVAITGLVSVILTAIIGVVWFVTRVFARLREKDQIYRVYLALAFIIAGTFVVSVFFHPRSYDGWRHIYYIYPCMVAFSVYVLRQCIERVRLPFYRVAAVIIGLFFIVDSVFAARFIVRNHPNQYLYFNMLAGGYEKVKVNFDMDYWGISYKQLLDYLLSLPVNKPTSVYFQQQLPYTEFVMIPALKKKGMTIVASVEEADLYVTINRDFKDPPPSRFHKAYTVTVEGADVSAVYVRDGFIL